MEYAIHMIWDPQSPSLRLAFVCYADILGFREMTKGAFESGNATEFLVKVKGSLGAAYKEVRKAAKFFERTAPFEMKALTDNIFLVHPLTHPSDDLGEPDLGTMSRLLMHMQASLAADGFFLRGAIAIGEHYQDQDFAYGDALLEAVDQDKSGQPPRLVIGTSIEPLISKYLSWYSGVSTPHHAYLLEDASDGRLFINYLNVAFENFPDSPIDWDLPAAHREHILESLNKYESNDRVLPKYTWLAAYHDYICRMFADAYSTQGYEEADTFDMAVEAEACKALDYLVSSEEQLPFRLLSAERLPPLSSILTDTGSDRL